MVIIMESRAEDLPLLEEVAILSGNGVMPHPKDLTRATQACKEKGVAFRVEVGRNGISFTVASRVRRLEGKKT